MRRSGKQWSYRRAAWVGALVGVGFLVVIAAGWLALGPTRGGGMIAGLALVLGPLLIGLIVRAPGMDREFEGLVERGYSETDARKRVARNAAWSSARLFLLVGAWGALLWLVAAFAAPGSAAGRDLRMVGGMAAFQLTLVGAIACWAAWRFGRVVGHGQHCAKCGYPTPPTGIPICAECGRVFAYSTDQSDGRVERPAWMLPLAIAATLAVGSMVVVKGWRGFAAVGMGVAPTSTLVAAATGTDDRLARSAWQEIPTRTLDAAARRSLINGILTRWETDGALPTLLANKMIAHLQDELITGAMDGAAVDRLAALAPRMDAEAHGRNLATTMRRSALTDGQRDALEVGLFLGSGHFPHPWMRPADGDLARRFAAGALSPALEGMFIDAVRGRKVKLNHYTTLEMAAAIAERTDVPRIRDAMLGLFLEQMEADPSSRVSNMVVEPLRVAIVEGALTPRQCALALLRPSGTALFEDWYLKTLSAEQRARTIDLFVDVVAISPAEFAEHQPAAWRWVLRESAEGRLNGEQAALMDAAAEAVEENKRRITP